MDEETEALLLSADVDETWERSPLSREAIARIFAAPAGPLTDEPLDVEALYLTLARISDWLMHASFDRPKAPRKAAQEVADSYIRLFKAYPAVMDFASPPPLPPVEWMDAMRSWIAAEAVRKNPAGRPKNDFDRFAYPTLLAVYQYAFQRKPAATVDGPTERFMMTYLRELHAAVALWTVEPADKARLLRERWRLPEPDTLRVRIRTYEPFSEEQAALPAYYWPRFRKELEATAAAKPPHLH